MASSIFPTSHSPSPLRYIPQLTITTHTPLPRSFVLNDDQPRLASHSPWPLQSSCHAPLMPLYAPPISSYKSGASWTNSSDTPCHDMIPKSLTLLGLFLLSPFICWGTASSQDQSGFGLNDTAWCAGLGGSTVDTLANFRLYAWNTDRPNDNSTGIPLVLATTGATAAAYGHTLVVSLQLRPASPTCFEMSIYH